ncbi:hypothetical protein Bhyg_10377 [Pseudolycoriella hygida]|uniref:Superoxide dismutase copper/zinc binding domain-containing protein n=1 Tax=Pseudolycoriella hygida TaxID=35572 RepID=A0A9Q0MTD8_9DIPT|nr:hypothetical protein Bhyg_10377 [Pseudolycoriella hygida]
MKFLINGKFYFCYLLCIFQHQVNSLNLIAYVSQNGLFGHFQFSQYTNNEIKITSELSTTLQYPDQIWSWGISEFPVDYSIVDSRRCSDEQLGKQLINFDDTLGYLTLPGNETTTWFSNITLTGGKGLWGKSLVLANPNTGFTICATISTKEQDIDHLAEARFHSKISGSIYFRWLSAKRSDHSDTLIYSDLYHNHRSTDNDGAYYTSNSWKLYITDIFDDKSDKPEENCNVLQLVFDPENLANGKSIGDVDSRLGNIKIASKMKSMRQIFQDDLLKLLPNDLTGPQRQLYVVVFDSVHKENFLGCAKIRHVRSRLVKSTINNAGIKGEITLQQKYKFEPTWVKFKFGAVSNEFRENVELVRSVSRILITDLPPNPVFADKTDYCSSSGKVFNPTNVDLRDIPPNGLGTQDQYPIGDITGKLKSRNPAELSAEYWDIYLPLEGSNSIVHRGFVIEKNNNSDTSVTPESKHLTCGTLTLYDPTTLYQTAMFTAEVLFRYPIVGRILFRQPRDESWVDTTVIVEYLIHADGSSLNKSIDHRWAIHHHPPGKDFYNWTARCLSAGDVYNPYKVNFEKDLPTECFKVNVGICRLGDLFNRLGTLAIAGRKAERDVSRKMFTDVNLPLSGHNNILGKSLVIYDDFGPVARGERLACSIIGGYHWRKAVARDWYANGVPLTLSGKLEIFQQSEYDLTNVDVHFKDLNDNKGYHVHITPIESDLEFPCEDSSLYGHWNPRDVDPKKSPHPAMGTSDQYELGDLSGKFGTLENAEEYAGAYNDTILPLYGYETVLGRSIVIHKRIDNIRWACSTLERGYSPQEAREIRAIASFHHPNGFAYGYIRFTQLIHNDGSKSDTVIEVKLQHPGENDRNITFNHHWNIFVNPVGVDATVQQTITRCVAGGYIWNPFYTQLADPLNVDLYRAECGSDNPLRCYVGDVSARVGTIDIGNKRVVFSDQNFPLEGSQSAVGRSIVIFGPNYSAERFACANIEPDHDIVKYINLQKPPKFVVAQFLEDVRHVMGLPKWMLSIDSRKTKTLHNDACIQMIVHFKGAQAHQIEIDFSKLLTKGRLDDPIIRIPGYVNPKRKKTLSYRICSVRDPNEKNKKFILRPSTQRSSGCSIKVAGIVLFVSLMLLSITI